MSKNKEKPNKRIELIGLVAATALLLGNLEGIITNTYSLLVKPVTNHKWSPISQQAQFNRVANEIEKKAVNEERIKRAIKRFGFNNIHKDDLIEARTFLTKFNPDSIIPHFQSGWCALYDNNPGLCIWDTHYNCPASFGIRFGELGSAGKLDFVSSNSTYISFFVGTDGSLYFQNDDTITACPDEFQMRAGNPSYEVLTRKPGDSRERFWESWWRQ